MKPNRPNDATRLRRRQRRLKAAIALVTTHLHNTARQDAKNIRLKAIRTAKLEKLEVARKRIADREERNAAIEAQNAAARAEWANRTKPEVVA